MNNIPADKYIMIIGAMKSGTTTLFETLSRHPAICPSHKKEPEFFSTNQWHGSDRSTYEAIFDYNPKKHKYCLEASTGYTKYPTESGVPKRIKDYGLNPFFIYCVRDPLDRMESQYNYLITRSDQRHWLSYKIANKHTISTSMYYMQVEQYLKHFENRDRYILVNFDDIKHNVLGVANNICHELGLDNCLAEEPERKNKTPDTSRLEAMMMRSPVQWRKFIPLPVRQMVKKLLRRYDSDSKVYLTEAQRDTARDRLRLDMRRFEDEFDFPVGQWGF